MKSYEHREIGDAATGGALVNVGGEAEQERSLPSFGDVVALSGDYFPPASLLSFAGLPGREGTRTDTRDELVCALKVTTVDEAFVDPRFGPRGRFGKYRFSPRADRSDAERRIRGQ